MPTFSVIGSGSQAPTDGMEALKQAVDIAKCNVVRRQDCLLPAAKPHGGAWSVKPC